MFITLTRKYRFLDTILIGKHFFLSLILAFSVSGNVSGQILIAGTSFDPIDPTGAASRAFIGLNDITQYGLQTGVISSTPPLPPTVNANVFNASYYYAIANNPFKLDNTRYSNWATTDYSYVYSPRQPVGTNINILQYSVSGMVPGSVAQVKVWYCSAVSSTYTAAPDNCTGARNEFKAGINLDASNQLNGNDVTQIGMGQCVASYLVTGTASATGDIIFRMNATRDGACEAMAITQIEIYGTPQPKVIAADGTEVCAGEQVTLQAAQNYNATYQWYVSTDNGGSFNPIVGATSKTALYEATLVQNYQFRAVITPLPPTSTAPITTTAITVAAITCCTEGGHAASRQTIYYDNFGRLDMTDHTGKTYYTWDYSNPLNPVEVSKSTTTPFRWTITPAPLSATFVGGTGTFGGTPARSNLEINDGQYTVAAYLTSYNPYNGYDGALLGWAARTTGPTTLPNPEVFTDHSGSLDGGVLLLNCPPSTGGQVLYTRNIPSLCLGKQLFFECWIAVFTNSASGTYNGVDVNVRLTDGGNALNVITLNGTANRQADGGGVWVKISGQITLVGNSMTLDIINNKNTSVDGNDLALDDIKIMACSPPPLDLYFDLPSLAQTDVICSDATEPLYINPSTLLKNYYGNAPMYIYQWTRTPSVVTSWKNFGVPQAGQTYTINNPATDPSFLGLTNGGTVYFRVVAASAATFTLHSNFSTVADPANINDPCKNYSVSTAIAAVKNCTLPVKLVSFTGSLEGDLNLLTWITSSEKDNDYFIVERSTNGTDFNAIGRVRGNGNTNVIGTYHFNDNLFLNGINYYRLKQVDINGTSSYSKIITIYNEFPDLSIYPNPNHGSFAINMTAPGQSYKFDILDVQGKIVYTLAGQKVPEMVDVNNLSEGFYVLRLYIGNQIITRKLVVY